MKVFITGASGFVGKALHKLLLKQGDQSHGFTRDSGDQLIYVSSYEELLADEEAVLVHLAQNRNISTPYDPQAVEICRNLAARPWQHIIYASSTMVYGDQHEHPRRPDEEVFAYSGYSRMKIDCERIFAESGATCLRLSNLYGVGMCDGTVVTDILRQIPGDDPLKLRNPNAIRDFLWIEDAVECIAAACAAKVNAILNVGSGQATAMGEVARLTLELVGETSRSVAAESEPSLLSCLKVDITKTQSLLTWSPKTDLLTGLAFLLSIKP